MESINYGVIKVELKKALKSRGVKYKELAQRMKLSESGVKKLLNGNDLSFNKICSILDTVGISTLDFLKVIGDNKPTKVRLTEKQEKFFLRNISHYYFFDQLLRNDLDWKAIKDTHHLTKRSVEKYLIDLDKIEAIELLPNNKVISRYSGNLHLTFGMPLVKKVIDGKHQALLDFSHIPNQSFRGRKKITNGVLRLSPQAASEFIKATDDVISEFMNRSEREKITIGNHDTEDIGFLSVITPVAGMQPETIPNV